MAKYYKLQSHFWPAYNCILDQLAADFLICYQLLPCKTAKRPPSPARSAAAESADQLTADWQMEQLPATQLVNSSTTHRGRTKRLRNPILRSFNSARRALSYATSLGSVGCLVFDRSSIECWNFARSEREVVKDDILIWVHNFGLVYATELIQGLF